MIERSLKWITSDHRRLLIAALAAVSMVAAVYTFAGSSVTVDKLSVSPGSGKTVSADFPIAVKYKAKKGRSLYNVRTYVDGSLVDNRVYNKSTKPADGKVIKKFSFKYGSGSRKEKFNHALLADGDHVLRVVVCKNSAPDQKCKKVKEDRHTIKVSGNRALTTSAQPKTQVQTPTAGLPITSRKDPRVTNPSQPVSAPSNESEDLSALFIDTARAHSGKGVEHGNVKVITKAKDGTLLNLKVDIDPNCDGSGYAYTGGNGEVTFHKCPVNRTANKSTYKVTVGDTPAGWSLDGKHQRDLEVRTDKEAVITYWYDRAGVPNAPIPNDAAKPDKPEPPKAKDEIDSRDEEFPEEGIGNEDEHDPGDADVDEDVADDTFTEDAPDPEPSAVQNDDSAPEGSDASESDGEEQDTGETDLSRLFGDTAEAATKKYYGGIRARAYDAQDRSTPVEGVIIQTQKIVRQGGDCKQKKQTTKLRSDNKVAEATFTGCAVISKTSQATYKVKVVKVPKGYKVVGKSTKNIVVNRKQSKKVNFKLQSTSEVTKRERAPLLSVTQLANDSVTADAFRLGANGRKNTGAISKLTAKVDGKVVTGGEKVFSAEARRKQPTLTQQTLPIANLSDGQPHVVTVTAESIGGKARTATINVVPQAPPAPPVDTDGDGVPDEQDECADTPQGATVNSKGCPLVSGLLITKFQDLNGNGKEDSASATGDDDPVLAVMDWAVAGFAFTVASENKTLNYPDVLVNGEGTQIENGVVQGNLKTNDDGELLLENLPPGKYTVAEAGLTKLPDGDIVSQTIDGQHLQYVPTTGASREIQVASGAPTRAAFGNFLVTPGDPVCANPQNCPSSTPTPDNPNDDRGDENGNGSSQDGVTKFLSDLPTSGASALVFVFSVVLLSAIYYAVDSIHQRKRKK